LRAGGQVSALHQTKASAVVRVSGNRKVNPGMAGDRAGLDCAVQKGPVIRAGIRFDCMNRGAMDQDAFVKQAGQVWQQMSKAPLQRIISRLLPVIERYLKETGITLDVLTEDLSRAGFRTRQGQALKEGTVRAALSRARRLSRLQQRPAGMAAGVITDSSPVPEASAASLAWPLQDVPEVDIGEDMTIREAEVPELEAVPLTLAPPLEVEAAPEAKPGSLEYERLKVQEYRRAEEEKQRKDEERKSIIEVERQKRLDAVKQRRLKRTL